MAFYDIKLHGLLLLGIQVGCSIRVCIARLDEETNDLIISEKNFLNEGKPILEGNSSILTDWFSSILRIF